MLCAGSTGYQRTLILHTNDTHSRVEPIPITDPNPEFAGKRVCTSCYLNKEIRKQDKDLLLFDCGDFHKALLL